MRSWTLENTPTMVLKRPMINGRPEGTIRGEGEEGGGGTSELAASEHRKHYLVPARLTFTKFSILATAVAHCKAGRGLIKVNGSPLNLVKPEVLRFKVYEPLLIVGLDRFANVDIRVRVNGGGHTSQVYAIRQGTHHILSFDVFFCPCQI